MSVSNLLTESATVEVTSSLTADSPMLEVPSTPNRSSSPARDNVSSPTDTVTTSLTEEDAQESAEAIDDNASDTSTSTSTHREFTCMNDEYTKCRTGQYTLSLSRKVISDHFGRNKSCTRDLTSWPLFCRKHYQRATYNKSLWQLRKVTLILRQFDIIESQFPGTTYDITLKKSEEDRLNEFSRKIAAGVSTEAAAAAVKPVLGTKAFEAPIDVLRELDQYIGKGKTMQEVKDAMDVVGQMLHEKETEQVPAIEFLPLLPGKRGAEKSPRKASGKGVSPRTSARGGVKKTGRKV
ncbi:hypothetical protein N0V94_001400 [Neodidymelliopsis sp. IMI 364377]|nr:hypothetical protein N0V94_001400 [Neodidymelliopsis sp. IMI 364377]